MDRIELNEDAPVYSSDGEEIGKINRFVLHPVSKKVTHIVVEKGLLFPEDKVVPFGWVATSQTDRVTLSEPSNVINDLPPFEEMHYIRLDESEQQNFSYTPSAYIPSYYWYPPYGTTAYAYSVYPPTMATEVERNIPENTVALQEGADVISIDGNHIGDVERLFANPDTNKATHFLISKGLFLKERKLVPVEWITTIKENKVQLAVGEKIVDQLPDFQE